MALDFKFRKRLILGAVGLLVVADAALIAYSVRESSAARTPQEILNEETRQFLLSKADVERAQKIRKDIPATQADCDKLENSLPPAQGGYSAVESELAAVARKAGVKIIGTTFHEKAVPGKPFVQVILETAVEGDYPGIVKFLNGLQKLHGLYIVDEVMVGNASPNASGTLRINLHVETYFRAAS